MKVSVMDDLDKRLLDMLNMNARESVSSLALALNVSRATIKDRMSKLEKAGIIKGYGVRLGQDYTNRRIAAHVMVSVDTNVGADVIIALKKMANLDALYAVSGIYDMIAVLHGETTEEIDRDLDNIRKIRGISNTTSSIILSTKLEKGLG